jgi:hypothetical protein
LISSKPGAVPAVDGCNGSNGERRFRPRGAEARRTRVAWREDDKTEFDYLKEGDVDDVFYVRNLT